MLNSEQQRAVEHQDGPLLVIAGAGSGKTRVVTTRICHLIEKGGDPSQILGLTFTNKAAQEMRERVRSLMQAQVMISTFHSLGAFILRESIGVLGYTRSFTIYDEEDVMKLLKGLVKELELSLAAADVKSIRHRISQAKNALISPEECAKERAVRPSDRVFPTLYAHYQERLKTANAVDFDDLIGETVRIFKEHPQVTEYYRRRFRHVLIDEYQDTNHAQYVL
ncbi:MAG: UvrD-helicase domain-containing protein, partial [Chlamydiia bacterium]|nr:UvrD-helicase domain-containing protein [Chlamydiia bacterium]